MQQLSQLLGWKSNHSIDKGKKYQVCAWGYLRDPFFWASSFCSFSRSAFKLIGFFWCTSFSWRKRTEEEMNPVSRKRVCSNITQTSVVALYALQRNWYWAKKWGTKYKSDWRASSLFAGEPQGKKAYFLFLILFHASPKSLLCTILRANSSLF